MYGCVPCAVFGALPSSLHRHCVIAGQRRIRCSVVAQAYTYLLASQEAVRTREQLQALAAEVKAFGLTRAEAQQLLDLRPSTLVELHLVISDCEARVEPERLEELLALVVQRLRG